MNLAFGVEYATIAGNVTETPVSSGTTRRRTQIRVGAVLALAAVAAFVIWLLVRGDDGKTQKQSPSNARAVSEQTLRGLRSTLGRPIYWAGPRSGTTYELTQTKGGRVFIRYLPKGVEVGTSKPYLTVATYRVKNAIAATERAARQSGSVRVQARDGAVAFYRRSRPTNVYLAFPESGAQIEVFAPSGKEAQRLVSRHRIQALRATTAAHAMRVTPVATSPDKLKKLAAARGRPIYWAGTRGGTTYELTNVPGGRIFIRYLPRGVQVGATKPYLTVATYPLARAFADTRAAANRSNAVKVPIKGGIAFYTKARPTSVYVAFPGVDEQMEVFHPSARSARALVTSGRIRPVP
jgi:hypothetical protein